MWECRASSSLRTPSPPLTTSVSKPEMCLTGVHAGALPFPHYHLLGGSLLHPVTSRALRSTATCSCWHPTHPQVPGTPPGVIPLSGHLRLLSSTMAEHPESAQFQNSMALWGELCPLPSVFSSIRCAPKQCCFCFHCLTDLSERALSIFFLIDLFFFLSRIQTWIVVTSSFIHFIFFNAWCQRVLNLKIKPHEWIRELKWVIKYWNHTEVVLQQVSWANCWRSKQPPFLVLHSSVPSLP